MEAAGAILIAITNVPEACSWVESTNGIYGLSKNPYDTRLSVGGSSGGEGALISAADTLGSLGVIPLDGHVPMPKEFQIQMLRIGPMCRYVEDVPLLMEVMGGELAVDLHLKEMVDFNKVRFFYMEGIQHTPKPQSLSSEMRCALLKAVSYFEQKFDVEGIRLDLPLASNAIEMLFSCIQAKNTPTISESFKSLKGDRGSLNWMTELPKLLAGKSVHTAAALFLSFFESMDRTSEKEKAKLPNFAYNSSEFLQFRRLRDRLARQVTETLGDDGILLFPSWPTTAPYHHQTFFTPFNTAYTGLFNALTLPVITCPMGLDRNTGPSDSWCAQLRPPTHRCRSATFTSLRWLDTCMVSVIYFIHLSRTLL
ncbi:Amidase [Necator americanus]|uniref:Amidase n=1 Tax=Necator americanus TaxID=51031 RepID=W2SKA9_NECAM|nr:Amidase [Necator americanus]ETN70050.1 Amidase [Necator americanus]